MRDVLEGTKRRRLAGAVRGSNDVIRRRRALVEAVLIALALCCAPSSWAQWQVNGVPLCTDVGNQNSQQVTTDEEGGAIAAWTDWRHGNADIYAQRIDGIGHTLWSDGGVSVCTASNNQLGPQITADGSGGAIVTWYDQRSGGSGDVYYDIYAQRMDPDGNTLWTGNGIAVCIASSGQKYPKIAPDDSGGAIITWEDGRSSREIYAQRIDGSGSALWHENGVPVSTLHTYETWPCIVPSGDGGAIVCWRAIGDTTTFDVYAQKLDDLGVARWMNGGVPACVEMGMQDQPRVACDGAGGGIVVWSDGRNPDDGDIYAQRIYADGNVAWVDGGIPVCAMEGGQGGPEIVMDDSGGAIIAWHDRRDEPSSSDVYAQRVDSSGELLWAPTGVPVSTAPYTQFFPKIASDGAGGAFIAWADDRGTSSGRDIFARWIDADGTPQGEEDGTAICTAEYSQDHPAITYDGRGGAILAWDDYRAYDTTAWDVYAGWIEGPGGAGVCSSDAPEACIEVRGYPNPFGSGTTLVFSLPEPDDVGLAVYDLSGRLVATLGHRWFVAGRHEVAWNGRDARGEDVGSGVYFCRLERTGTSITHKLVLLR